MESSTNKVPSNWPEITLEQIIALVRTRSQEKSGTYIYIDSKETQMLLLKTMEEMGIRWGSGHSARDLSWRGRNATIIGHCLLIIGHCLLLCKQGEELLELLHCDYCRDKQPSAICPLHNPHRFISQQLSNISYSQPTFRDDISDRLEGLLDE